MSLTAILLIIFIFLFGAQLSYAQTPDILVSSFEEYPNGNINNQDDWDVEEGSASVSDSLSYVNSGIKGLNFIASNQTLVAANTSYSGSQAGVSGIVYVDLFVKINSMSVRDFAISGFDLYSGSRKRAFVFEFDTPSGSNGLFQIYNGSSKVNIENYNLGEWNRISARVDYENAIYQVIFNGSEVVTASFRESYSPTSSGSRQAGIKEYHEIVFNLGYNSASGNVNAAIDDIYISSNPIPGIAFPEPNITYSIDVEQPHIGSIEVDPDLDEYPDSSEITATLTIPPGYMNQGWTGDLSGTELIKSFFITNNMQIGAVVAVDTSNPPPLYTVTVNQPDFGEITLTPPGGVYYDFSHITAELSVPTGYINEGWTGDLSGTALELSFTIHQNMEIGATVVLDTTSPNIYRASSASEFHDLCQSNLIPGDIVELDDGYYDTGGITMEASGTESRPIIIRARNVGAAELGGGSYFVLSRNAHVIIEGFHFTSDPYTVIKLEACNNIRITRNTFQLSEDGSAVWIKIGGYWDDDDLLSHHNRIDHNIFRDKQQLGNFIQIDGGNAVSQHDRIDHNYFYNIGPRQENEMEAIRVGWSALSLTDGFTVIEYNLFEECDGDPEIISIKSCKDTVRYNTIRRSQGTVSLRHGDGSVVHDNYFLGDGKEGTGGVRVYARNHKIYNNYFEGLRGYTWDAAITLTNGDSDTGSLSSHWRIDNLIVSHNTLVNNYSNIEIGYARADGSWTREPRNVIMANNLVAGEELDLIRIFTTPTSFNWSGNIMYPLGSAQLGVDSINGEINIADPDLNLADSLWLISANSPAIDAAINNYLDIQEDFQGQPREGIRDVGADEYSTSTVTRFPLTASDVGPYAPDIISALRERKISQSFVLFKNYPNPFNPSTTLKYFLPRSSEINITIYNVLGQKIATLVNELKRAGIHYINWNAASFSSGTYFATINTGHELKQIKLLLIK